MKKVTGYRGVQGHKSKGDPCKQCGQPMKDHSPDRARLKKYGNETTRVVMIKGEKYPL